MALQHGVIALVLLLTLTEPSIGAEAPKSDRQKVIDFEDDVVEGMNKRPLDSLNQIAEARRRRKHHLYRKRAGFKTEVAETLRALRYTP